GRHFGHARDRVLVRDARSMADAPRRPQPATPRAIAAWCMFDWANSAFTTIVITFVFATYFVKGIAVDEVSGTSQWAWAIGLSGIAIAILSPIFGAIADHS